jgi:hypothetical protein
VNNTAAPVNAAMHQPPPDFLSRFSLTAGEDSESRCNEYALAPMEFNKIVASFSSSTATESDLKLMTARYQQRDVNTLEDLMPRFYFDLISKRDHITDRCGKELSSLNDAYEYAGKLIDKILFHVGCDDKDAWKVVISSDKHNAQMIVPFAVFETLRGQDRR